MENSLLEKKKKKDNFNMKIQRIVMKILAMNDTT